MKFRYPTAKATIYIEQENSDEVQIFLEGDYIPGSPGGLYEPPESAYIEVTSAKTADGTEVELTEDQLEKAEEALLEAFNEVQENSYEPEDKDDELPNN